MIRSGSYRIMGPANHSLAYGLILISGLPLLCIDEEKHCFTLFRHLPLLLLVVVNVFLTGSRSTLAVMGLELLLLTVLAPGEQRKKLLFTIVPAGLLILLLAFLFLLIFYFKKITYLPDSFIFQVSFFCFIP